MQRFKPLDVFRGMTVCFMIIVNTPGNYDTTYSMLLHAKWHGFTPTDLVFPSFLFAVGNAIAFARPKWQTWDTKKVYIKLLKRFLIIFILGYLMYWFPFMKWSQSGELLTFPFAETRVFGVLQRIAICYLIGALLIIYNNPRQLIYWSVGILLGYWAVMGFGGGYEQNTAAHRLDLWLLGSKHLYQGYGYPFDPEGLLSSFPAVVNVLAGYLVGIYVIKDINYKKLAKLLLAGCILMATAYLWNTTFPINKPIWTSSYVLLTIGLDMIVLGAIIYLMTFADRPMNFPFFEVFGKNALFIYLLSEYLAITLHFVRVGDGESLFHRIYEVGFRWMTPYVGSFVFALCFMLLCWGVGKWLDRRKVYIKV